MKSIKDTCRMVLSGTVLLLCGVVLAQGAPEFGDDSSEWANDGECDDPRFAGKDMASTLVNGDAYRDATDCRALFERNRIRFVEAAGEYSGGSHAGVLAAGDNTLETGEYFDSYYFDARIGDEVVVQLEAGDFDPYLMVVAPGGEQFDNDDHDGDATRSLLAVAVAERGRFEVRVTSYEPGETGGYAIEMNVDEGGAVFDKTEELGELEYGDEKLDSGEFVDKYQFLGKAGQRVRVDLVSNDFDTYVILVLPSGEQIENDDGNSTDHSWLEADMHEAGRYRVFVTSFEPGESGQYVLMIDQTAPAESEPESETVAGMLTAGMTDRGSTRSE